MNREQLEEEFGVWGIVAASPQLLFHIYGIILLIHLEMALAVTTIVIGLPVEFILSKGFRRDSEKMKSGSLI